MQWWWSHFFYSRIKRWHYKYNLYFLFYYGRNIKTCYMVFCIIFVYLVITILLLRGICIYMQLFCKLHGRKKWFFVLFIVVMSHLMNKHIDERQLYNVTYLENLNVWIFQGNFILCLAAYIYEILHWCSTKGFAIILRIANICGVCFTRTVIVCSIYKLGNVNLSLRLCSTNY